MAIEGVVADPGSGGTEFAVDEVSGGSGTVSVPYTKLMSGADASAELIGGDAANGLDVDVTRLPALATGANVIGAVTQSGTWNVGTVTTVTTVTTVSAVTAITNALPAGTNAIGKLAANSGVDIGDVDVTSIAAGTNTIGGITPRPETANGLSIARDIDLDNSTLTVVKNSAGQLYGWDIANLGTVTAFVKFYDATSGTLGTGTPVMTVPIPGNASDDTLSSKALAYGITFATGICVGAGTGVADNDTGDPGANIVIANIYYK